MFGNYFYLILSLAVTQPAFGMNKTESKEEVKQTVAAAMVKIKSWQEVKPFAGHMIVYQTNNNYFPARRDEYQIRTDSPLAYGYVCSLPVSFNDEQGYVVLPALRAGAISYAVDIMDSMLSVEEPIYIRQATAEEVSAIIMAAKGKKARFARHRDEIQKFMAAHAAALASENKQEVATATEKNKAA